MVSLEDRAPTLPPTDAARGSGARRAGGDLPRTRAGQGLRRTPLHANILPVRRIVAVFGPGHPTREEYNLAAGVGRLLAERGIAVCCGGLFGVMEAACMGAKEAGGVTIGILRSYTRHESNAYVDYVIPSGLGDARNVLVATAGEGAIAVGGRFGTLSEIAIALKHGVPVVGLKTWRLERDALFDRHLLSARTPEEAVDLVLRLADERAERREAGEEPDVPAEEEA